MKKLNLNFKVLLLFIFLSVCVKAQNEWDTASSPYWFSKRSKKSFSEYLFAMKGEKEEVIFKGKEIVKFVKKPNCFSIDSINSE